MENDKNETKLWRAHNRMLIVSFRTTEAGDTRRNTHAQARAQASALRDTNLEFRFTNFTLTENEEKRKETN